MVVGVKETGGASGDGTSNRERPPSSSHGYGIGSLEVFVVPRSDGIGRKILGQLSAGRMQRERV